jgi:hypothetical protein
MTPKPLTLTLLAAAALAASAPAAAGAALKESRYDVTFEVRMVEDWKVTEHHSKSCSVDGNEGRCDEDVDGAGRATLHLRTSTPKRVSVTTGIPRMQPMIVFAADSGIPLKGSYKRTGKLEDIYTGLWDAANEDSIAPTSGCGDRAVRTDVALGWQGRNRLAPVLVFDDLVECPSGPMRGFDYAEAPSLGDVVAGAGETKFGRTKQFRVAGSREWNGTYPAMNRTDPDDTFTSSGESRVSWSWAATFRKVTKKTRRGR